MDTFILGITRKTQGQKQNHFIKWKARPDELSEHIAQLESPRNV